MYFVIICIKVIATKETKHASTNHNLSMLALCSTDYPLDGP